MTLLQAGDVSDMWRDVPRSGHLAKRRPAWLFAVLVAGDSMMPTLTDGDALLVRRTGQGRVGGVAVVRFLGDQRLYVKRVAGQVSGGWWVLGDNPGTSLDSRNYGPAEVVGRVLVRWWPKPARVGSQRGPRQGR